MVDIDAFRRASRDQWERSAGGWGREREWMQKQTMPVSRWLVDAIAPQPGHDLLEVAAGTGDTGFLAAELIRPAGRLMSTDLSEPMLEVARARAKELGLDNVHFRQMGAEGLDFSTGVFDGVLARWGYMLTADPETALREARRVLRPGGRLALSAWDAPGANQWASVAGEEVRRELQARDPEPGEPGMFAFSPPGRLQDLLAGAGFAEIVVEPLDFIFAYDSTDHFWDMTMAFARPLADFMEEAEPDERERVRDAVDERLAGFAAPDGSLPIPARALVASAAA